MSQNTLYERWKQILFLFFAIIIFLFFLYLARQIILFFSLALLTAIALNPLVSYMENKGIHRGISVIILILFIIIVFSALCIVLLPSFIQQLSNFINDLPILFDMFFRQLNHFLPNEITKNSTNLRQILLNQLLPSLQKIVAQISTLTFSLLNIFIFTVSFFSIVGYALTDPTPLLTTYVRMFPKSKRKQAIQAYTQGAKMTVGWLKTNLIEGFILGMSSWLFLTLFHIPGANIWGLLTFVLSFIPRLGPYIMTLFPALVAFIVSPTTAAWVVIFYIGINELVGDIIDPYLRSSQMQINPILILFAVFSMTYTFGFFGAFIATPIAGFVKAFYEVFFIREDDKNLTDNVKKMVG